MIFGIAIVPLAFALANQCLYFLPVSSVTIARYVICKSDKAVWVVEVGEDTAEDWTEDRGLGDTSAESGGGEVASGADMLRSVEEKVFNPRAVDGS